MAKGRFMRKTKGKKAGAKRRARENNQDTHNMVIKVTGSILPVEGERVSNMVYGYWSPSAQFNPGVTGQSMPLANVKEWNLFRNLYDQFRVNSVTLTVIPRYTQTESSALALLADNKTITMGKGVYYTVEDRDGPAPSNIESLKRYSSVKQHKITSRMSRKYSVKYAKNWFDCQDPAGLTEVQRSLGLLGGITVYGESFPEITNTQFNGVWADIEVAYNVTFCGKAMIGLTLNEDGSVLVSQPDPEATEALQQYKTNEDNIHAGAVDLSGNTIL